MSALVRRLFDDAALFPPGNAPMEQAVPQHLAYRAAWYRDLVGPFLCPDTALPRLREVLSDPLSIGLIVPSGAAAVGPAIAAVADEPRLELVVVEVAGEVRQAVAALDEHLPSGVTGYVEVPRGPGMEAALDLLASTPYRPKFRTGGLKAEAFPTERELAAFITACAVRELPFKCTAGLHHAVRHTDPVTGFEHHGFLNVLFAVDSDDPVDTLGERSGDALAARVAKLTGPQISAMRERFRSFGTCDITEPLDDLTSLGLLQPAHR